MARKIRGRHFTKVRRQGSPLESDIQSRIKAALERVNFHVTVYSEHERTHIEPGHPDMRVTHEAWGIAAFLETKTPSGRISKAQRGWHARERAAGGTVLVVRSVEEAIVMLGQLPRAKR